MMIILGLKGNEWAWKNRKWESVEQFKATHKSLGKVGSDNFYSCFWIELFIWYFCRISRNIVL